MKKLLSKYKKTYSGSSFYFATDDLRADLTTNGFKQSGIESAFEIWRDQSGTEVAINVKHDYFTVFGLKS